MVKQRLTGEAAKLIRALDSSDAAAQEAARIQLKRLGGIAPNIGKRIAQELSERGLTITPTPQQEGRTVTAGTGEDSQSFSLAAAAQLIAARYAKLVVAKNEQSAVDIVSHGSPVAKRSVSGAWSKAPKPESRIDILLRAASIQRGETSAMVHNGAFVDMLSGRDTHAARLAGLLHERLMRAPGAIDWAISTDMPPSDYSLLAISGEVQQSLPVLKSSWLAALAIERDVPTIPSGIDVRSARPDYHDRRLSLHVETLFAIQQEDAELLADGHDFSGEPLVLAGVAGELAADYIDEGRQNGTSSAIMPAISKFAISQTLY